MNGQPLPVPSSTGLEGHSESTGRHQHLPTPALALGAPSKSGDQKDDNRSVSLRGKASTSVCRRSLCREERKVFLDLLRVPGGVSKLN